MENSAYVKVTWQHHRVLNLHGTWCFCGNRRLLGARAFVSEASGMWLSLACDVWLRGLGWISLNKGWELRAVLSARWAHGRTAAEGEPGALCCAVNIPAVQLWALKPLLRPSSLSGAEASCPPYQVVTVTWSQISSSFVNSSYCFVAYLSGTWEASGTMLCPLYR